MSPQDDPRAPRDGGLWGAVGAAMGAVGGPFPKCRFETYQSPDSDGALGGFWGLILYVSGLVCVDCLGLIWGFLGCHSGSY